MTVTDRRITVEWDQDGFHRWPEAEGERSYLADRHRHRFHFAVTVPVLHGDRQIEFHDLLDYVRQAVVGFGGNVPNFGRSSCEELAELVVTVTTEKWPTLPWVEAAVSEDGYVTGSVRWEREA